MENKTVEYAVIPLPEDEHPARAALVRTLEDAANEPPSGEAEALVRLALARILIEDGERDAARRHLQRVLHLAVRTRGLGRQDTTRARSMLEALDHDEALAAIRAEVVELSLGAATKVLGRNVNSDDDRRLVQELVGGGGEGA